MSILPDDGSIIGDSYEPSEAANNTSEDPTADASTEYDTSSNSASEDTISGGEGSDYGFGADGVDIILSGFSIGDEGFWF